MIQARRRARRFGRGRRAGALVLLAVLGFGYGPVPALGPALDPGRGA